MEGLRPSESEAMMKDVVDDILQDEAAGAVPRALRIARQYLSLWLRL